MKEFDLVLPCALIGLFLLFCLFIGFKDITRIKTLKDFALGPKSITTATLVATIYATHLGAGAIFGLIEQINNIGVVCTIVALVSASQWYINNIIFCKNINRFDGCISSSHIMQKLYGSWGLWVSNIVNVITSVGTVAIQIAVIGFVAQYFFRGSAFAISAEMGVLIGAGTIIVYSLLGGVMGVILTDVLQAVLFLIIVTVIFALSIEKFALQPDFFSSVAESKLWVVPYDWNSGLLLMGIIVYALFSGGHDMPFIQRMLISASPKQLKKAYAHVAFLDFVVSCMIAAIAIFLLPKTGEGTLTKIDIFNVVSVSMSPVVVFITIIGILAITMSTADSWLNSGAVIVTHDIVKAFKEELTENQAVLIARLSTLLMGIAAAWLALFGGSILSLLLLVENFCIPLLSIPLAAGFLNSGCDEKDFRRSVVFALTGVFLGRYLMGEFSFISLLLGLISSAIGLFWFKILKLRLPPKGKLKYKFLKEQPVNSNFFMLVFMGTLVYTFIHMYISSVWVIADLAVLFSIAISVVGFLYASDIARIKKSCAAISIMMLVLASINLVLRENNFISLTYFILFGYFSFIYRQVLPFVIALPLGYALKYAPFIVQEMPVISLTSFLISMSIFCVINLYIYLKNIKEQLEEEKILSAIDTLTNLYNRRYMDAYVDEILKNSAFNAIPISVLAIDIDYFKLINDTYGHSVGDKVLQELGKRIAANFRPETDLCIRTGGEEFIIIMQDVSFKEAQIIAERFRNLIETTPFEVDSMKELLKLQCTISIGVTELEKGDTIESITNRADKALYHSKRHGRNRVTGSKSKSRLKPVSA